MNSQTVILASIGGVLIGLASAVLLATTGRIAGISGIAGRLLRPAQEEVLWRVLFIAGLLLGAVVTRVVAPQAFGSGPIASTGMLVMAGLLVGFGTRMANGCTSGHGVCGLSRRSPRSLTAVMTFMLAAAATVFVTRHVVALAVSS